MKTIEITGTVDAQGNLVLDRPIQEVACGRVRVLVFYSENLEPDLDDTPLEEVKASLRKALEEAKSGQILPISQLWEGIDI